MRKLDAQEIGSVSGGLPNSSYVDGLEDYDRGTWASNFYSTFLPSFQNAMLNDPPESSSNGDSALGGVDDEIVVTADRIHHAVPWLSQYDNSVAAYFAGIGDGHFTYVEDNSLFPIAPEANLFKVELTLALNLNLGNSSSDREALGASQFSRPETGAPQTLALYDTATNHWVPVTAYAQQLNGVTSWWLDVSGNGIPDMHVTYVGGQLWASSQMNHFYGNNLGSIILTPPPAPGG